MLWLRSFTFNLFFYVWTTGLCLLFLPSFLLPPTVSHFGTRLWIRGVLAALKILAGIGLEVRGSEHLPEGPVLFAAKHQSAWDTIALLGLCRYPAMVMKRELMWLPFYGWYCRLWRMIPVDRNAHAKALRLMLARAQDEAKKGRDIFIFPQGSRIAPGTQGTYHPGAAALYMTLGLPCVPVALNAGYFWPRQSFLRHPGTVVVEFLPPLEPGLARHDFMHKLEDTIETASNRLAPRPLKQSNTV